MKISEIAAAIGGKVEGGTDHEIQAVAGLGSAGPEDLSFAEGPRAEEMARDSRAGCILVALNVHVPGKTTIAVANPKLAFARAAALLVPTVAPAPGIHPTA